jgi:hypothetical protein
VGTKKLSAADRHDTWDAGWEQRLVGQMRSAGAADAWDYLKRRPAAPYASLADELSAAGGFGVAPVQIERLQVRDTPEAELRDALRDSLVRHLRVAFRTLRWGEGPYWESRVLGALVCWAAMWTARTDVSPLKRRLFDAGPPQGWMPEGPQDPFVRAAVPAAGVD